MSGISDTTGVSDVSGGALAEIVTVSSRRATSLALAALYLSLLVPLIVMPGFFFPFVTTRNIFFRLAVEMALGIVVWVSIDTLPTLRRQADPIMKWLAGFVVAFSIAAVLGVSPWHSMFGDFERMGGVLAWVHLLAFYVLLRILLDRGAWRTFFRVAVIVAVIVVAVGSGRLLAPLPNLPFVMGLFDGSTIGNSGLLAPYLLFPAAFGAHLFLGESRRGWRAFYLVSLGIIVAGIVGSGNRSTPLGLVVGATASITVLLWTSGRRVRAKVFLAMIISLGVIAAVGGRYMSASYHGTNRVGGHWAATFASGSEAPRTMQWTAAIRGFAHRPIFGFGPENHEIISSRFPDPASSGPYAGGVFDRPHNTLLEILSTGGLISLIAMLGVWWSAVLTVRRGMRESVMSNTEGALWIGVLIAYAFYLFFWFFDVNAAMMWVAALAAISTAVHGRLEYGSPPAAPYRGRRLLLVSAEIALGLAALLQGIIPLKAAWDTDAAIGRAGNIEQRLSAFYRVMGSSSPQSFHTMPLYIGFLTQLTPVILASRGDPYRAAEFDYALKRGFIEAKQNIRRDSENPRAYAEQAQLSSLAMVFYGKRAYGFGAMKTLVHAIHLAPRHVEYRAQLARIALALGDTATARVQLDTSLRYAPNYAPAYYQTARIAFGQGDLAKAQDLLRSSTARGYAGSGLIYVRLGKALEARKEFVAVAKLQTGYIEAKFGKLNELVAASPFWTVDDKSMMARLPILFLLGGDKSGALRAARAAGVVIKEAALNAKVFADDLKAGREAQWKTRESLISPP